MIPRSLALAIVGTLAAAAPVLAGPPWISIEYPANPYDRETRGALLTLHTYHHGIPLASTVVARADGVVNGVRRTIELTARATERAGVYAVSGELPAGGTWVISCTMGDPETSARATALLAIGADGKVAALDVPVRRDHGWITPREATASEVNAMLTATLAANGARASASRAGGGSASADARGGALLAGLAAVALVPLVRRRRGARAAREGTSER